MVLSPSAVLAAWWMVLGSGCGGCQGAVEVCPISLEDGAVAAGDANGDGRVDIADGLYVERYLLQSGPELACVDAVDLLPNGAADAGGTTVDVSDGIALWNERFVGTAVLPTLKDGMCATAPERVDEAPCGMLALDFSEEEKVKASGATASFEADLTLTSPDLAVEGWSVAVRAKGCEVAAATVSGTVGAEHRADDAGVRDVGFELTEAVADGAVSAVVLSWRNVVALEPRDDARVILHLSLTAPTPDKGCAECTLAFQDGLEGRGQPVPNRVTVAGRSYEPELGERTIKVCAD